MDTVNTPSPVLNAGLAASGSYGFYKNVSVGEVENGFVVSFYTTKSFQFYCADLDAVKSKLQEVFGK
jgi:hypothetical protein